MSEHGAAFDYIRQFLDKAAKTQQTQLRTAKDFKSFVKKIFKFQRICCQGDENQELKQHYFISAIKDVVREKHKSPQAVRKMFLRFLRCGS